MATALDNRPHAVPALLLPPVTVAEGVMGLPTLEGGGLRRALPARAPSSEDFVAGGDVSPDVDL